MTDDVKAALQRQLIGLLRKLIARLTDRLAEQQAHQDASEAVEAELVAAQDVATSEATQGELTEEPCEICEAHKKGEMLAHFLNLMAEREGTGDHIAAEGDFTHGYGIKDSHVIELINQGYLPAGTQRSKYSSNRDFANAVYGATYDRMLKRYDSDVLSEFSNELMAETMSAEINMGSFSGSLSFIGDELNEGNMEGFSRSLLWIYNSGGKPMLGLAKRRAIEYNRIREAAGIGGPFIASIETTGTRQSTAIRYLDANGSEIFQGNANPLHPKSSLGPMKIRAEDSHVDRSSTNSENDVSSLQSVGARISEGQYRLGNFSYDLIDQHDSSLYVDDLHSQDDVTISGKGTGFKVNQVACLAAVYLMIERARKNKNAVIGDSQWTTGVGANLAGFSSISASTRYPYTEVQVTNELDKGNPVIVELYDPDAPKVLQNHYVLVVGYDNDSDERGRATVLDPLNGEVGILNLSSGQYNSPTLKDSRSAARVQPI